MVVAVHCIQLTTHYNAGIYYAGSTSCCGKTLSCYKDIHNANHWNTYAEAYDAFSKLYINDRHGYDSKIVRVIYSLVEIGEISEKYFLQGIYNDPYDDCEDCYWFDYESTPSNILCDHENITIECQHAHMDCAYYSDSHPIENEIMCFYCCENICNGCGRFAWYQCL